MHRQPRPDNPSLGALLDDRDHLRIRISLLLDSQKPDAVKLESMQVELKNLEKRISRQGQAFDA
jgi:hypothetical protein